MSDHCIAGIADGLLVLVTFKALSPRNINSSPPGFLSSNETFCRGYHRMRIRCLGFASATLGTHQVEFTT